MIKEHVCANVQSLPFKHLPKIMIIGIVQCVVQVLNQFPAMDGVSDMLSPLTIMTGWPNPYYNSMKIDFGANVQVFEDNQHHRQPHHGCHRS